LTSGAARRFELPTPCLYRVSLNTLEFLGAFITLWIDILEGNTPPESCILSQTDSTSAAGWLRKSCFDEDTHPAQMHIARMLARVMLMAKSCLYSQWFEGKANIISDCLSRDFHLTDNKLTSLLTSHVPHQMPPGFKIRRLPKEIDSWLISLLLSQIESKQLPKEPQRSDLAHGVIIKNTSQASVYKMSHSWIVSQLLNGTGYWDASHKLCAKDVSVPNDFQDLLPRSSSPPWITYLRPLGLTTGRIPAWTTVANLPAFYNLSTKDTQMQTHQNNPRKRSLAQCSKE